MPDILRSGQALQQGMNQIASFEDATAIPTGHPAIAARKPALAVEGIRHAYHRAPILDDVSFGLSQGEILALVGHSGSGKSTLLRIIAGLERPQAGSVMIGGRPVCGPGLFVPPERRGIGLMFQDYALFPHMTNLDNVRFGLAHLPKREAETLARRALENVGLGSRADDYPHALSGGEQQRIALARALAPSPAVLLMDEPFSNLDRRTRDVVRDETVSVLRNSGASAILVTHDPEEAMRLADRVVLLRAGRVAQAGTPEELYRQPASLFVARFFSEFDEVDGVVRSGRADTLLGSFPASGMTEGAKAKVCIRPSAIRIGKTDSGVEARVLSRRFLGDSDLLHVGVEGIPKALHARVPANLPADTGEAVRLDLAHDEVMVFAAD